MKKLMVIIGLLLTAVCFADTTIKLPHTIKVGDHYLFAAPALQIAYGAIGMVEVSGDSRYIAFQYGGQLNRTKINYSPESTPAEEFAKDPNNGLYVYDRVAKQSSLVQRLAVQGAILESATWVEGLSLLYLEYATESGYTTAFYSPQTKKFTTIVNRAQNSPIYRQHFYVPNQKVLVSICYAYDENRASPPWLEFYDSNGNYIKSLNPKSLIRGSEFFVQNGKLFNGVYDRTTKSVRMFELNLNTGELMPSNEVFNEDSEKYSDQLVAHFDYNQGGVYLMVQSDISEYESQAYQASTPPALANNSGTKQAKAKPEVLIITRDGMFGEVIGMNQGVWYVDRSGLYLLDLIPMSAKDYDLALADQVKRETMNRAKQVGTAMMIYGADYDDCFPLAQGWAESIYPYIKNNSLTDGFVYMLNGENMTEIEDITGTIIGFIETPYGTAYVRGDSSVVWKDKPKPLAYLKSLEALRN
ncbi:MAG: hypothetical protein KF824_08500 [Fimbriimonadaceae bacterium]|nr:MAG: hypothetical protein KF824_08500 [Fimbriimonadaceae bacterium]